MKGFWIMAVMMGMLASCRPGQSWMKQHLDRKEAALVKDAQYGRVDSNRVHRLLDAYEQYAASFSEDSAGAAYLFKAADFYRYLHRPEKSVSLYRTIYERYPNLARRPYALFLQGFIFENEMGNTDSARVQYEKFLAAYPQHPIAGDVKITLQNLGKTPEQLIEEFQAKQAQETASTPAGK